MSYIKKTLIEDEELIFHGKQHWLFWIKPLFYSAILLTLSGFFVTFKEPLFYILAIGFLLWNLFIFFYYLIQYKCTEYAITTRRVIFKTGFLRRDTNELKNEAIENIQIDQMIMGRMFGYGELSFTGTGGSRVVFGRVSNPTKVKKKIENYNDKN